MKNKNIFNSIPLTAPKYHRHNLSHYLKTTMEMGKLVPIFVQDVLPGERMKMNVTNLIRFAPMLAPVMSEIDVYVHFFFVPNRIIWSNWETFITGSEHGTRLSEDLVPEKPRYVFSGTQLNAALSGSSSSVTQLSGLLQNRSLADYLGFQTWSANTQWTQGGNYPIDALPFWAYQKIYDDYYRDENFETSIFDDFRGSFIDFSGDLNVAPENSPAVSTIFRLRTRKWKKDYFTSALPWPQKGEDVLLPNNANFLNPVQLSTDFNANTFVAGSVNGNVPSGSSVTVGNDVSSNGGGVSLVSRNGSNSVAITANPGRFYVSANSLNNSLADSASEGTIRELRRAFAAQKFLERRAIGGTRYIEQNLAFFGVKSSDGRLQRAEFLGGSKNPVVVSQLLQTSETTDSSPLGQPAGNAVSAGSKYIFDRSFEEYGWVIGICSVMPKADYIQGIPRMYLRRDVYDYFWPQFAHIGEQPIYNQEIFFNPNSQSTNEGTFGYTPRYAEYRFRNNRVCGDFKDTLKFWTLARDFSSLPGLNSTFLDCNPSDRIFAVESSVGYQHLWCEFNFNCRMLRPVPKYAESL